MHAALRDGGAASVKLYLRNAKKVTIDRYHRARGKKGKQKRRRAQPTLTLKSFVLQEAEAVGREAKIRAATALGLRVVNLQHDGIVVRGVVEGRHKDVARVMSEAVTAACGYEAGVTVERVRHVDRVD